MKVLEQTIYEDDQGNHLLTVKEPGQKWYIPLGTIDRKTLAELGQAINHAVQAAAVAAPVQHLRIERTSEEIETAAIINAHPAP